MQSADASHLFHLPRPHALRLVCRVRRVRVHWHPTLACWRHGTMARPLALWKPARHRLVRLRRASVLVSVSFLRSSHPPPLTVDPFTCTTASMPPPACRPRSKSRSRSMVRGAARCSNATPTVISCGVVAPPVRFTSAFSSSLSHQPLVPWSPFESSPNVVLHPSCSVPVSRCALFIYSHLVTTTLTLTLTSSNTNTTTNGGRMHMYMYTTHTSTSTSHPFPRHALACKLYTHTPCSVI